MSHITGLKENEYYTTRAESHGSIYKSTLRIGESENKSILSMEFSAEAQSFMTKFMSATIGLLFKGATIKALKQDLEDIKKYIENQ